MSLTATARAMALLPLLACSAPHPVGPELDPEPEVDDLDLVDDSEVLGPRRIIDPERAAAVIERLPFRNKYRGMFRETVSITASSALRETVEGEPGGFVSRRTLVGRDRREVRFEVESYYASAPPYRLLARSELLLFDGAVEERWDVQNGRDALWLRGFEGGVARRPVRCPPSQETLAAELAPYVPPDLLPVGAMQTFPDFDPRARRDRVIRVTVRDKGRATIDGRIAPVVTFEIETEVGVHTGTETVAGGRYHLRLEWRDAVLVRDR